MALRRGEGLIEGLLGKEGAQTICSGVMLPVSSKAKFSLPASNNDSISKRCCSFSKKEEAELKRCLCNKAAIGERLRDKSKGADSLKPSPFLLAEVSEDSSTLRLTFFSVSKVSVAFVCLVESTIFICWPVVAAAAAAAIVLAAVEAALRAFIFKAVAKGFKLPLSKVKHVVSGFTTAGFGEDLWEYLINKLGMFLKVCF